jgi:hypothetical protein
MFFRIFQPGIFPLFLFIDCIFPISKFEIYKFSKYSLTTSFVQQSLLPHYYIPKHSWGFVKWKYHCFKYLDELLYLMVITLLLFMYITATTFSISKTQCFFRIFQPIYFLFFFSLIVYFLFQNLKSIDFQNFYYFPTFPFTFLVHIFTLTIICTIKI